MYIRREKKGGSIYLSEYESYREGGKVKQRFIRYLGKESEIKNVPLPLKSKKTEKLIYPETSLRAGDVKVMWELSNKLGFIPIINQLCHGDSNFEGKTSGIILTAMAINQAIEPESTMNIPNWINSTVLPNLFGLPGDYFSESAFYTALDRISFNDDSSSHIKNLAQKIDYEIYKKWRLEHPIPEKLAEIIAYDVTPILFFGDECELADYGYNSKKQHRKQINLCVLISKFDRQPVIHFEINGNFNSMSSVKELLSHIISLSLKPGYLIWDRGNSSEASIEDIEKLGWKIICGIPKTRTDVQEILSNVEVPLKLQNMVPSSNTRDLYAVRIKGQLYGKERSVIVYTGASRRINSIVERNSELERIKSEICKLNLQTHEFSKKEIEKKISDITGNKCKFFNISIDGRKKFSKIFCEYNLEELEEREALEGKWLIYSTDSQMEATDIVYEYMQKDYVEKAFRTLKTHGKIAPVSFYSETHVRAYLFVNMLALRLRSAFKHYCENLSPDKKTFESAELMRKLKRVEYVEHIINGEKAYWFLNLQKNVKDQLSDMGLKNIFIERRISHL